MNELYGLFQQCLITTIAGTILVAMILSFVGAPLWLWTLGVFVALFGFGAPCWTFVVAAVFAVIFNLPPLRRLLVSAGMLKIIKKLGLVPYISATEQAAIDAGQVWVEAEYFTGHPDLKKLMAQAYPSLTEEEKRYVDGPIEELCQKIDNWKIHHEKDIPADVFEFMKQIKIFGMIIPKEYGGLDFSALAHSQVILKLASRSIPVAVTAMVPNSLGPAELLKHYGTKEQKDTYLPKLATGEEIPCFALTEPRAGSDAGSIESEGVLFKKDGKLFVRLNWNKRWISLSGISTVLGIAFVLLDPEKLLGKDTEIGITCALVPSHAAGIHLDRRHDPLGIPFVNCPTQGVDVEISVDQIIGGIANAGKGWTMLMECLSAGRGISLPSLSVGTSKLIARVTGAHSTIRKQFGLAIYKLEGVEEPLGRIAGLTYALEAMRMYTQGALNQGIQPPIVTAICKYQATENARKLMNDGMDIMAGAGITLGPRNLLAPIYQASPISITVEGANILTRTLITFGQGLFRAHPFAYKEVAAINKNDLKAFDINIWAHLGHVLRNFSRTILLSLTRGRLAISPVSGPLSRYYQKLGWASATFAFFTDVTLGALGEKLKRDEKISGRFADILSWMYINTAVLRRHIAEGSPKEDLPFAHFALQYGFHQIQESFEAIFQNLPVPGLAWFFRSFVRGWYRLNPIGSPIPDRLGHETVAALVTPGAARDRLSQGIYYPQGKDEALARLERAYQLVKESEPLEKKINQLVHERALPKDRVYQLIAPALKKNLINAAEAGLLRQAAEARWDACQVDDFSKEVYHGKPEKAVSNFKYHGPAGPPSPADLL